MITCHNEYDAERARFKKLFASRNSLKGLIFPDFSLEMELPYLRSQAEAMVPLQVEAQFPQDAPPGFMQRAGGWQTSRIGLFRRSPEAGQQKSDAAVFGS